MQFSVATRFTPERSPTVRRDKPYLQCMPIYMYTARLVRLSDEARKMTFQKPYTHTLNNTLSVGYRNSHVNEAHFSKNTGSVIHT